MEYSFKNSVSEKLITVSLNEFDLAVTRGTIAHKIPYAGITEVRLGKRRDLYFIDIISLDYGDLLITNRWYEGKGKWKDQDRAYQTFVRVLHHHLAGKSQATFYYGRSLSKQAINLGIALLITALVYLTEEYFDLLPVQAWAAAGVALILLLLIQVAPKLIDWPRTYAPSEIPIQLLPPA